MTYQLSPEGSPFTRGETIGGYHLATAALLVPDVKRGSSLGVVCLPSFESEWSLVVEEDGAEGFTATLRTADEEIWSCFQQRLPTVSTVTVSLPIEMARTALAIWSGQLMRVGYDSPANRGLDGETYHLFMSHNRRQVAGATWSPNPSSLCGQLIAVAHTLHEYVAKPADQNKAVAEFDALAGWFNQRLRDRDHSAEVRELRDVANKMVGHVQAGIFTPDEVAKNIAQHLANAGYPPIGPLLEILGTLPEAVRQRLRVDPQG